jgi:hypothetical protein
MGNDLAAWRQPDGGGLKHARADELKRVLLVSTLQHNPGDDFIRFGVEHVLRRILPAAVFNTIHKHDPRTIFAGFRRRGGNHNRFVAAMLYRLYAMSHRSRDGNLLDRADLIAFAGTPFIWRAGARLLPSTCANAEWIAPTWGRLFSDLRNKPVLNLAAGTGAPHQKRLDGILSDRTVMSFIERAAGRAALTTARDAQTRDILRQLDYDIPLIPCTSLLAARGAAVPAGVPEYVAVNVMRSAAHIWRRERVDQAPWHETIDRVVAEVEKRHKVLFVSHSHDEDQTAAQWFPGRKRFFSTDPMELLKVYSRASFGVCNRVHAAAGIATFARPALVVGGDSRINLVEHFGLPAVDYREVGARGIIELIHQIEGDTSYPQRLQSLADQAEAEYIGAVRTALGMRC